MKDKRNIIMDLLAKLGWWLYVKTYWRNNKTVQSKLDADTRDNLGFYLRADHTKFNF